MEEIKLKNRMLNQLIDVPLVDDIGNEVATSELDSKGRASATGRRKRASARVWISTGEGFEVNHKKLSEYFPQESLQKYVNDPFHVVGFEKMKVFATVVGGGSVGQAQAIRHGIARALLKFDPMTRKALKASGFLTRDSRKKERKTPGFRTARKPQQFSKR